MLQNLFKSEQRIIAEIHNEFDTAQERLLEEAKAIINSKNDDDKAKRMEALGFTGAERVTSWKKQQKPIVESEEQAKLIEYYKQNYPFQKFLTESELDCICEKYGLIHAPVANYLKGVPEKNLREIENAPALHNDVLPQDEKLCIWRWDNFAYISPVSGLWAGFANKWRYILPKTVSGHFAHIYHLNDELNKKYNTGIEYIAASIRNITINRQGLFIAAPKSHFNLKDLKQHGKHGMFNFTMFEVKDPIVFRYCRGGIQVLSKWGLEANDEALVNEINN